jgi:hypothetical protein
MPAAWAAASPAAISVAIPAALRDGSGAIATVTFTVGNVSDAPAINPEIWVRLPDGWSYAKEPTSLVKLNGAHEQDRYRRMVTMNPEVFTDAMFSVEINIPSGVTEFPLSFRYACETCGHIREFKTLRVFVDR